VTGLGTVGAFGCGRQALEAALRSARPALSLVDRSLYHRTGGARRAALACRNLAGWVPPAEARRMSAPSRLAVAAARMALEDAGLGRGWTSPGRPPAETAVVVSTAFGPSSCTEGLLQQIFLDSPESASPFLFTESVANAPAAQIAIATRARGAGITLSQREAGPLLAVGSGAAEIALGRSRRALAGSVEEITPLLHAVLDRFGALARPRGLAEEEQEEVARPFDRRRDGFLAGEGATVLVLEEVGEARRRGARALARVAAWGSAFDSTAAPTGWGEGAAGLAGALVRCLERAGLRPGDVDLIVSGASGSREGDRLEALTLHAAWGEAPLPPVLAPKGVTGEYGGGFLAAALLAVQGVPFGPTAGFAEPDPELRLFPHGGGPLPTPRNTLVTSLAAGGAAAWLVLARPEAA